MSFPIFLLHSDDIPRLPYMIPLVYYEYRHAKWTEGLLPDACALEYISQTDHELMIQVLFNWKFEGKYFVAGHANALFDLNITMLHTYINGTQTR